MPEQSLLCGHLEVTAAKRLIDGLCVGRQCHFNAQAAAFPDVLKLFWLKLAIVQFVQRD